MHRGQIEQCRLKIYVPQIWQNSAIGRQWGVDNARAIVCILHVRAELEMSSA